MPMAPLAIVERAENISRTISDPYNKALTLIEIADFFDGAGGTARASRSFSDAMKASRSIRFSRNRFRLVEQAPMTLNGMGHTKGMRFDGQITR